MYVVGEYILVEPFDLEKTILVDPSEKKRVSPYGTVVRVGKLAKEHIEEGTVVRLVDDDGAHSGVRVGKRYFLLTLPQNVHICFDDMKEYKKAVKDEAALKKEEESRQEPVEPKTKPTNIITLPGSVTPN